MAPEERRERIGTGLWIAIVAVMVGLGFAEWRSRVLVDDRIDNRVASSVKKVLGETLPNDVNANVTSSRHEILKAIDAHQGERLKMKERIRDLEVFMAEMKGAFRWRVTSLDVSAWIEEFRVRLRDAGIKVDVPPLVTADRKPE